MARVMSAKLPQRRRRDRKHRASSSSRSISSANSATYCSAVTRAPGASSRAGAMPASCSAVSMQIGALSPRARTPESMPWTNTIGMVTGGCSMRERIRPDGGAGVD
ncbi:hypothetical protein D3C72_1557050 [compost metagenome]